MTTDTTVEPPASTWPVIAGRYVVGNPNRSVAVCTLASSDLVDEFEGSDDIAIAGRLYTLNLGLEKLVWNVIANPSIRFLLLCGDDSAIHISRGITQLHAQGVDADHRLIDVEGYQPFVHNLSAAEINTFRQQVEVVDQIGVTDVDEVLAVARALEARTPGPYGAGVFHTFGMRIESVANKMGEITLDGLGLFLVSVQREAGTITLDHYSADRRYRSTITGTSAEAICHTLVREGLLGELSHAAYIGREVAKAEEALRWGLQFEQDRALFVPGQGGQWAPFGPSSARRR